MYSEQGTEHTIRARITGLPEQLNSDSINWIQTILSFILIYNHNLTSSLSYPFLRFIDNQKVKNKTELLPEGATHEGEGAVSPGNRVNFLLTPAISKGGKKKLDSWLPHPSTSLTFPPQTSSFLSVSDFPTARQQEAAFCVRGHVWCRLSLF